MFAGAARLGALSHKLTLPQFVALAARAMAELPRSRAVRVFEDTLAASVAAYEEAGASAEAAEQEASVLGEDGSAVEAVKPVEALPLLCTERMLLLEELERWRNALPALVPLPLLRPESPTRSSAQDGHSAPPAQAAPGPAEAMGLASEARRILAEHQAAAGVLGS